MKNSQCYTEDVGGGSSAKSRIPAVTEPAFDEFKFVELTDFGLESKTYHSDSIDSSVVHTPKISSSDSDSEWEDFDLDKPVGDKSSTSSLTSERAPSKEDDGDESPLRFKIQELTKEYLDLIKKNEGKMGKSWKY